MAASCVSGKANAPLKTANGKKHASTENFMLSVSTIVYEGFDHVQRSDGEIFNDTSRMEDRKEVTKRSKWYTNTRNYRLAEPRTLIRGYVS